MHASTTLASVGVGGVVSAQATGAVDGLRLEALAPDNVTTATHPDRRAERTPMPVIRIHDQEFALQPGQTRLGGGTGVDVRIADDEQIGLEAIVDVISGSQVLIRRAGRAAVKVNGVPLAEAPAPLMHGDKVEIAGHEMFFSDDAKTGATQYVTRSDVAGMARKRGGGARATVGTGGRLVSLVDGKEYVIGQRGVSLGRDASSDIVVAQNEVSRRHAEIVAGEGGYIVHDYSTNGVYVNGARVEKSQLLSRSDVLRIGDEEFRFYADVMLSGAMPAGGQIVSGVSQAAAAPAIDSQASSIASADSRNGDGPASSAPPPVKGADTKSAGSAPPPVKEADGKPAIEPAIDVRPVLATLEIINEGPRKGSRFEIRTPLAHLGRGAHNDVAVDDDSVSDTHAKLQRREDGWYLVDTGSTNGTYVGGSRLTSERRLDGTPDIRLGNIKMNFQPADVTTIGGKGTRAIAGMSVDRSKLAKPKATVAPAEAPASGASSVRSSWLWLILLVAVAAVAFFLLKS
jgi:pSer/pThr/pTyr-binding forkhead associated (FHA) protein